MGMEKRPFKHQGFNKPAVLSEPCTGCWLRRGEIATQQCKLKCLVANWWEPACMGCVVQHTLKEFEPCLGSVLYERVTWTNALGRIEAEEKAKEKKEKKDKKDKKKKGGKTLKTNKKHQQQ